MPGILVVDDDGDTRDALRGVLLDEGFEVRVAADGREAIGQMTGPNAPALVLLDSLMPEMNGAELLEWLAGRPELDRIQVVLMSADARSGPHRRSAAVLRKPFALDQLMSVARQFCPPRGP